MDAKDTGCHLRTSLSEDGHLNIGTYKQGKQLLNPFWHEKPIPKSFLLLCDIKEKLTVKATSNHKCGVTSKKKLSHCQSFQVITSVDYGCLQ